MLGARRPGRSRLGVCRRPRRGKIDVAPPRPAGLSGRGYARVCASRTTAVRASCSRAAAGLAATGDSRCVQRRRSRAAVVAAPRLRAPGAPRARVSAVSSGPDPAGADGLASTRRPHSGSGGPGRPVQNSPGAGRSGAVPANSALPWLRSDVRPISRFSGGSRPRDGPGMAWALLGSGSVLRPLRTEHPAAAGRPVHVVEGLFKLDDGLFPAYFVQPVLQCFDAGFHRPCHPDAPVNVVRVHSLYSIGHRVGDGGHSIGCGPELGQPMIGGRSPGRNHPRPPYPGRARARARAGPSPAHPPRRGRGRGHCRNRPPSRPAAARGYPPARKRRPRGDTVAGGRRRG